MLWTLWNPVVVSALTIWNAAVRAIFLPFIAREEEKRGADGNRGHEKEKGEQGLAMEEEVFELAPNEADVDEEARAAKQHEEDRHELDAKGMVFVDTARPRGKSAGRDGRDRVVEGVEGIHRVEQIENHTEEDITGIKPEYEPGGFGEVRKKLVVMAFRFIKVQAQLVGNRGRENQNKADPSDEEGQGSVQEKDMRGVRDIHDRQARCRVAARHLEHGLGGSVFPREEKGG